MSTAAHAQREAVLTSFKEEPGVRVILISLKVSK